MNVSIEKIDNVNGKITVSIEENDYNEKVTSELKRIGKTHTLPGFRKGHISIDQLRRRFGKQVKSDVINQEVYEAVINYIRDNKLAILGEPLPVDVKEIDLNDTNYTFEYGIGLTPEINIDLKDVKLPYYNIEVSKDMIVVPVYGEPEPETPPKQEGTGGGGCSSSVGMIGAGLCALGFAVFLLKGKKEA